MQAAFTSTVFSRTLDAERQARNLSIRDLAEHCGVQSDVIIGILRHGQQPNITIVEKLARLFGTSIDLWMGLATHTQDNSPATQGRAQDDLSSLMLPLDAPCVTH